MASEEELCPMVLVNFFLFVFCFLRLSATGGTRVQLTLEICSSDVPEINEYVTQCSSYEPVTRLSTFWGGGKKNLLWS